MRNEKNKNNTRRIHWVRGILGLMLLVVMIIILLVASAKTVNNAINKPPKVIYTFNLIKPFKQISDSILKLALISKYKDIAVPIEIKAIEVEGEERLKRELEVNIKLAEQVGEGSDMLSPDDPLYMAKLQNDKWNWIIAELEKQKAIREASQNRVDMIARIDGYLANRGSPMQGCGSIFYDEAAEYGIEPRLSVAIAEGESSCGFACFAPYNAWGMLAYRGGFSSWQEGIHQNIEWLHRYFGSPQSAYDCPGYCEPSHPWMENVDAVRQSI